METITVRAATAHDLATLLALYREFQAFHIMRLPDRLRTPPAENEAEVRAVLIKLLDAPDAALFVAETAGVVIGLAEVYLRADAADPATIAHRYGHVQSLMVTAQSRGHGAGAGLMAAAARWARERGGGRAAAQHVGAGRWAAGVLRATWLSDAAANAGATIERGGRAEIVRPQSESHRSQTITAGGWPSACCIS
jgi:GNAT superfamily N-acetyltransferase